MRAAILKLPGYNNKHSAIFQRFFSKKIFVYINVFLISQNIKIIYSIFFLPSISQLLPWQLSHQRCRPQQVRLVVMSKRGNTSNNIECWSFSITWLHNSYTTDQVRIFSLIRKKKGWLFKIKQEIFNCHCKNFRKPKEVYDWFTRETAAIPSY